MRTEEIHSNLTSFAGLPVFQFPEPDDPDEDGDDADLDDLDDLDDGEPDGEAPAPLPDDVENHAWRVAIDDFDSEYLFEEQFTRFLDLVDTTRVRALIIGPWQTDEEFDLKSDVVIDLLVSASKRFPSLRALFLGDIEPERQEISWIKQSDITPLLTGFPQLEELGVKGGDGLALAAVSHENLQWLSIRTGGLGGDVVRAVGAGHFPALRTLELCLGSPYYGGDSTADDFTGILSGTGLPALRRLALADATDANRVAAAVAHAPIVAQLEELDLSLGDLDDEGAEALLAGQSLSHLKALDLNHHYISAPLAERLRAQWPTVQIDLAAEGTYVHDGERYIAVAE